MDRVDVSKIEKALKKLPQEIVEKFIQWVDDIENDGWQSVKRVKKYRDHQLTGERNGQRAIKLNYSYRVIYSVAQDGVVHVIKVEKNK